MSENLLPDTIEDEKSAINRREFLASIGAGLLAANVGLGANETMSNQKMDESLDFLKKYSTSLLESAIYLLKGTHDGITLTRPALKMQTPTSETLVGYAVTSAFSTDPDDERGRQDNLNYWKYVFEQPSPKIAVSFDASREPGSGSSWGQQNAHIHKGLGCRGVVTNGGVRDIGVFREVNFQVYSGSLTIGHGNPHFIEFGKPVTLYGATFNSGDVVCADEHGAIMIPKEYLSNIEEAVIETNRRIKTVAEYTKQTDFTPAGLADVTKSLKPATPWKPLGK